MTKDCPSIEVNGQFLEIVEKFFYLGDKVRAKGEQLTVL